jgi:hypothetical protein
MNPQPAILRIAPPESRANAANAHQLPPEKGKTVRKKLSSLMADQH